MSLPTRVAAAVTAHSKAVIVVLLLVTAAIGAGAVQVEQSSSLSQFQSDSTAGQKMDYITANFSSGSQNTTPVQVVVRGENVLDRESLLAQLRFEQSVLSDPAVEGTLAQDQPPSGVANLVATSAIRQRQSQSLAARAAELNATRQRLNETAAGLRDALDSARSLQREFVLLNRSHDRGEVDNETYRERAAALRTELDGTFETATAPLDDGETRTFADVYGSVRSLQTELSELNRSYQAGEINQSTYREQAAALQAEFETEYQRIETILADEFAALQERAAALREDQAALQQAIEERERPPLDAQIDQLENMTADQVAANVSALLSGSGGANGAFALMPSSYQLGDSTADATMLVVTQETEEQTAQGSATERIQDAQLAIEDLAHDQFGEDAYVFGSGIINDEINRSMTDSLAIVGPLALLFVLLVLVVAYRDPLDILLGLLGIGIVLLWTFGFMGWADIAFNQIFIAVPVLLIGLSIDYAIHVFMRHREERSRRGGDRGPAAVTESMGGALASVGLALVWVTATTVIGFLSNLISSVPPIREFGVVSAVGIVSALFVFGGLMPALKVEIDAALEKRGIDRRRRAFGTGGGAISQALSVGVTAARRAPWVVVLLVLLLSAGGAYGATQVDTSFSQSDFIAEDPPNWMDELPEPIRPGEYNAKAAIDYVNDQFVREDSTAQILIQGEVTRDDALQRLADAEDRIVAQEDLVVILPNGEANIQSPLRTIDTVAAQNQSFNQTVNEADTDGDGVPDRNVAGVYDHLFEVAPQQAASVVHREDGEYRAVRLSVSVDGGADTGAVAAEFRDRAASLDGNGLRAYATGDPVVFDVVNDRLLSTVVESLLVTLIATFLFLMGVYRITDGSAMLGLVTLLPVAFAVSWILGTMYLLGIPFNVLTGMITSLTVGLGVAYSIHISERYAHELGREDDPWTALRRTVTGTGGALLGSAATTVGGFGVLVFAILPPLRQFGLITGLTIIYAFLGSVLVLPTLLVLWTRYLGPGMGGEGETDSEDSDETGGSPPAATRSLDPAHVEPGARVTGTVTVDGAEGRVLLRETVPGVDVRVDAVEPSPAAHATRSKSVYVAWDLDGEEATLTYSSKVPENAGDEAALTYEGELETPDATDEVGGEDEAAVVSDIFERVLARGEATEDDLSTAAEYLADGRISRDQFERVVREWLRAERED